MYLGHKGILIGGILAILGGFFAQWLQAKYARKTRMDQIIAERAVDTYTEAYVYIIHEGHRGETQ
jgi:hypothetical protein